MMFASEFPKDSFSFSKSELNGLLRVYGGQISGINEDLIFFETENPEKIIKRVAFSKRIVRILKSDDLPINLGDEETYAIKEIRNHDKQSVLREVASRIGGKVNLRFPSRKFVIYNKNYFLVTEELYERSIKKLIDPKFKNKPMNHPSSISPIIARGMINVSGVKEGDLIADPFAGTGTILIEANRMGIRAVGTDKNRKMVNGGNDNLSFFSFERTIKHGDFSLVSSIKGINSIVTDPPYGRGSKIFSDSRKTLYKDFFTLIVGMRDVTSVFCLPNEELLNDLGNYTTFTIVDKIRVHSSLTRIVVKTP